MRPIGFSTGALALADFRFALRLLADTPTRAVELSALRLGELEPLLEAIDTLPLEKYSYISLHAPSRFSPADEPRVVELLAAVTAREWPVVVHPDTIHDFTLWNALGKHVFIENMDKRKPIGRTAAELSELFRELPNAGLCFDIAHARQCDGTMVEAHRILAAFGDRLAQVHISEVTSSSGHDRISFGAELAFRSVADMIPEAVPVIIESRVHPDEIAREIHTASSALPVVAQPVRAVA